MKSILIAFLFFVGIFVMHLPSYGQDGVDSLAYYSHKVLHPQDYNDLKISYDFFNTSYTKSIADNNLRKATYHLYYIANVEYKLGDYDASEASAVKAMQFLDQLPVSSYRRQTRNSFNVLIGMIYEEQNNAPKAIEFYSKALAKAETPLDSAKIYNNLSLIYKAQKDFKQEIHELEKAYHLLARIEDASTKAIIISNLGAAKNELNPSEGLDLLLHALAIRTALDDPGRLYSSYAHLSDYYYNNNDIPTSKAYALKAYELAELINSAAYKANALGMLTHLSADPYAKTYKRINDSLTVAKQHASNAFALMKYDASEANRKALVAELENAQLKNTRLVFIFLVLFLVLTAVLFYFVLRTRHKKEKLQQVYNTEKRISKKVHDEVANDVYHVMTKLQANATTNDAVLDDLEGIYNRTRDISKTNSAIAVDEDFNTLITDLLLSYKSDTVNIITRNSSKINWTPIPEIKKTTIYRVLQELMTNMRKHSAASVVVLNFKQDHKKITINYSDNGVGCTIVKRGGLHNTENRIASINGTLTFESQPNKGFKAQIII